MLINILYKNNSKEEILINKNIIEIPPIKAPNIILYILTLLLSNIETHKSKIKSKKKFNIIIKSKYIFILSLSF